MPSSPSAPSVSPRRCARIYRADPPAGTGVRIVAGLRRAGLAME